jgi:hypothetical protein
MPETVSDSLQVRSTRNDSGMIDRGWVFQIGYDYRQPLLLLAPKTHMLSTNQWESETGTEHLCAVRSGPVPPCSIQVQDRHQLHAVRRRLDHLQLLSCWWE